MCYTIELTAASLFMGVNSFAWSLALGGESWRYSVSGVVHLLRNDHANRRPGRVVRVLEVNAKAGTEANHQCDSGDRDS